MIRGMRWRKEDIGKEVAEFVKNDLKVEVKVKKAYSGERGQGISSRHRELGAEEKYNEQEERVRKGQDNRR